MAISPTPRRSYFGALKKEAAALADRLGNFLGVDITGMFRANSSNFTSRARIQESQRFSSSEEQRERAKRAAHRQRQRAEYEERLRSKPFDESLKIFIERADYARSNVEGLNVPIDGYGADVCHFAIVPNATQSPQFTDLLFSEIGKLPPEKAVMASNIIIRSSQAPGNRELQKRAIKECLHHIERLGEINRDEAMREALSISKIKNNPEFKEQALTLILNLTDKGERDVQASDYAMRVYARAEPGSELSKQAGQKTLAIIEDTLKDEISVASSAKEIKDYCDRLFDLRYLIERTLVYHDENDPRSSPTNPKTPRTHEDDILLRRQIAESLGRHVIRLSAVLSDSKFPKDGDYETDYYLKEAKYCMQEVLIFAAPENGAAGQSLGSGFTPPDNFSSPRPKPPSSAKAGFKL